MGVRAAARGRLAAHRWGTHRLLVHTQVPHAGPPPLLKNQINTYSIMQLVALVLWFVRVAGSAVGWHNELALVCLESIETAAGASNIKSMFKREQHHRLHFRPCPPLVRRKCPSLGAPAGARGSVGGQRLGAGLPPQVSSSRGRASTPCMLCARTSRPVSQQRLRGVAGQAHVSPGPKVQGRHTGEQESGNGEHGDRGEGGATTALMRHTTSLICLIVILCRAKIPAELSEPQQPTTCRRGDWLCCPRSSGPGVMAPQVAGWW